MSEFKTYRVRCCEDRVLAINISGRDEEQACDLAASIYGLLDNQPFEEIDASLDRDTFGSRRNQRRRSFLRTGRRNTRQVTRDAPSKKDNGS